MGRYALSTYHRNARIGALRRWCSNCKRKTALDHYGVCRFCKTKLPMDTKSARLRLIDACKMELEKKGEYAVDGFVRSWAKQID